MELSFLVLGGVIYIICMALMFWAADRHVYTKLVKGQLVANRTFTCGGMVVHKRTVGAMIPKGIKIPKHGVQFWVGEGTKFVGDCEIKEGAYIHRNCTIDNSTIHSHAMIGLRSLVRDSTIGEATRIGIDCYIEKTVTDEKCVIGSHTEMFECVLSDRVTIQSGELRNVNIQSLSKLGHSVTAQHSRIGYSVRVCDKSNILGCTLPDDTVYSIEGGMITRYGMVVTAHEFGHVYHMIQTVSGYYLVGTGIEEAIPMNNEFAVPEHLMSVYRKFLKLIPQEG